LKANLRESPRDMQKGRVGTDVAATHINRLGA
jgi:hypothetical protein